MRILRPRWLCDRRRRVTEERGKPVRPRGSGCFASTTVSRRARRSDASVDCGGRCERSGRASGWSRTHNVRR